MKSHVTQLRQLLLEPSPIGGNQAVREQAYQAELLGIENLLYAEMDGLMTGKHREVDVKRQFRQLQDVCEHLLSVLQEPDQARCEYSLINSACLQRLLLYHQLYFSHYFNADKRAPDIYTVATIQTFQLNQILLVAGLKRRKIAEPLVQLLTETFTNRDKVGLSYHQLAYLEQLQKSLISFCTNVANPETEEILINYLIFLNFNSHGIIRYVTDAMEKLLSECLNEKDQYEYLCLREMEVLRLTVKNESGFEPVEDSVKAQLLAYISAGIVFYHRNQVFENPNAKTNVMTPGLANYRVKLNISVDSLAYLIRLLVAAGVIDGEHKSKVMLFFAQHFQTPGIGDASLSANSLNTKSKQVVQRTAINLLAIVKKMQKLINQDFNL
ncbi:MAG: hypothetical protein EOO42_00920 [Flavobacteriales bacterium]|nr:MAG: hypothetical protein EOO42_00920 [Flavobacteriales bacterium]